MFYVAHITSEHHVAYEVFTKHTVGSTGHGWWSA